MQIKNVSLYTFRKDILVRCPRCEKCAHLGLDRVDGRLVCGSCGLVSNPQLGYGTLWLRTRCCGEQLWAFNVAHVAFLQSLVTAKLRERRQHPIWGWQNGSLQSRLPKWMLAAKNRPAVLGGLERLMAMARNVVK